MAEGQKLTLSMFSPHVGDRFQLKYEGGECALELIEAVQRGNDEPHRAGEFSLVFSDTSASAESFLHQAMYTIQHEVLGTMQIFIVPIGPAADGPGIRYEAVFT